MGSSTAPPALALRFFHLLFFPLLPTLIMAPGLEDDLFSSQLSGPLTFLGGLAPNPIAR